MIMVVVLGFTQTRVWDSVTNACPGEENQITKPVPHIPGGYERYPSGQPVSGNLARGPKIGFSTVFGPPGDP